MKVCVDLTAPQIRILERAMGEVEDNAYEGCCRGFNRGDVLLFAEMNMRDLTMLWKAVKRLREELQIKQEGGQ